MGLTRLCCPLKLSGQRVSREKIADKTMRHRGVIIIIITITCTYFIPAPWSAPNPGPHLVGCTHTGHSISPAMSGLMRCRKTTKYFSGHYENCLLGRLEGCTLEILFFSCMALKASSTPLVFYHTIPSYEFNQFEEPIREKQNLCVYIVRPNKGLYFGKICSRRIF